MKLSISNIAWDKLYDEEMYKYLFSNKVDGLEIAPTRIIEKNPYSHMDKIKQFKQMLYENYNLKISSMQSIWYGKKENIFKNIEEREELINYTKKAIDFAYVSNCKNLVFGCPKNRIMSDEKKDYNIAIDFLNKIGNYASDKGVIFSIEPNPIIYNTNFITTTLQAIKLVKKLNNPGIKINLDVGTMIQNNEDVDILKGNISLINHIHISEPNLEPIKKREFHKDLIKLLKEDNYDGYISIEMKNQNNIQQVKNILEYVITLVRGKI